MASRRAESLVVKGATLIAILLAVVVALYALFLLLVGEQRTVVPAEIPISGAAQNVPQVSRVEYVPFPPAVVPLLASAMLLMGLLTRKLLVAWIGLAVLGVFAGLFLFGNGGILLPAVGLLLILLIIISLSRRRPALSRPS